jgi:predicted secreted acid phosphatase
MPTTSDALVWALAFLGAMRRLVPKPAIVLDVDGTVLKNYDNDVAKCIVGFRSFVEACTGAGITVFIVTARPDTPTNRKWTERQLEACGLWRHVNHMYMRQEHEDTGPFKYESREHIRREGYTVLLSVGDQFLDLARKQPKGALDNHEVWVGTLGDAGGFAIKLPSEFPRGETPTP